MSRKTNSLRLYLSEILKSPIRMGSIWPSSPALGEAMARWLPESNGELMLELGPGTGNVTEKLLEAGLPQERLVAVEKSERLAGFLSQRFPKARIIAGDALHLDRVLDGMKFGAVFSSLPLKLFSEQEVERISDALSQVLLPGAPWVQFSYQIINGLLPAKSFRPVASKIVWQNFPPAKVSVYQSCA
jgi:phosphatidylethanolamine/phosphatidyl-N-methylethanolamine N-methyltransferase